MKTCHIGVDVGLTTVKASAYDERGGHLHTVAKSNLRTENRADYQEVDMLTLWDTVSVVLAELNQFLAPTGYLAQSIGVTGSGNGAYLVTETLQPSRSGIASTDTRAEPILSELDTPAIEALRYKTGSRPWAAQTPLLLKWLAAHEPETLKRTRWVLTCKDWITSCLTGHPSADLSDSSSAGLVNLAAGTYEPDVFVAMGMDPGLLGKFPPLSRPNDVVGLVTNAAAEQTGLPSGIPAVAGAIDVVAVPIGAGASREEDVTIIAGTWGINSVVHRLVGGPPDVTLNALFNEPGLVFAQEDAPTSMANMEWFSRIIRGYGNNNVDSRRLVEDISVSVPGAQGLLFIPFVHGAPQYPGASATLLGQRGHQCAADVSRALAEGITQYHRIQVESLRGQGVALSSMPWTLAGGGARNPAWAQIFANVLGHPVKRQLEPELGTRGVAALAFSGVGGDLMEWQPEDSAEAILEPNRDRDVYKKQAEYFDEALTGLRAFWAQRLDH